MRTIPTLFTITALLAGGSIAGAQSAPKPTIRGPLDLDVSGVRLNSSAAQTKAALAGRYVCRTIANRPTFEERVADEVKKRKGQNSFRWDGTGIAELDCNGPSGETLQVIFAHAAAGPVVQSITTHIPTDRIDRVALHRQLAEKYGRPRFGPATDGCWANVQQDCGIAPSGPVFRVSDLGGNDVGIFADRGSRATEADEAAVQAAADRLAPRRSGVAL